MDSPAVQTVDDIAAVPRFARVDEIFRRIVALTDTSTADVRVQARNDHTTARLITVSSAAGGVGNSTIACALARTLAMQPDPPRVVLLDLATPSLGTHSCTDGGPGPTMSDVIYSLKRRRGNLDTRLASLLVVDAYRVGGFPLSQEPLDALELGPDDLDLLIETLLHSADVDVLVLDVPFRTLTDAWPSLEAAHLNLVVTDGRGTANLKTSRALGIIDGLDSTRESTVGTRTSLVYNRFDAAASQALVGVSTPTLASVPVLAGASDAEIVDAVYASGHLAALVPAVLA